VQIHDRGVRDGLLLTMIERKPGAVGENPHDQIAAIERFAGNCGTDVEHGKQVARLAGLMLSQLIGRFDLTPDDRPLLEAAARLQDVGYLINYDQHHKHSYHLIVNSRLPGFKPRELEIVANVARYHRGSAPKKKHDNYRRLSKPDRKRVSKLAALLRIAGGLDRSNSRQVQAVSVVVQKDRVVMRALANENPEVDLWAAQRRAEMFEDVFGLPVTIEWHDPKQPASNGAALPSEPGTKAKPEKAAAERAESKSADSEKPAKKKRKPTDNAGPTTKTVRSAESGSARQNGSSNADGESPRAARPAAGSDADADAKAKKPSKKKRRRAKDA
jgi:hypothetical protein